MNSAVVFAEFLPKPRIAVFGTEECGVETTRQNFQFFRRKSPRNPASAIFLRIDKYAFQETIVGQNTDVLRKVGVINPAGLQVQHFRRRQRRQPNWPRRADNDFSESFALNVVEHAQDRWETKF